MRWPLLLNFRMRLLVLVGIAVLPAFVFILVNAENDRASARDQARLRASDITSIVNQSLSAVVIHTSQTLSGVGGAVLAGAVAPGTPGCDNLARAAAENVPDLVVLGLATPEGQVVCSSASAPATRDLTALQSFMGAKATLSPTIGDFELDSVTGKPTVWLAQPVIEAGRTRFMAVAAFDIVANSEGIEIAGIPAGSVVYILDRQGRVVVASPPTADLFGQPPPVKGLGPEALTPGVSGTLESNDTDGPRRTFGYQAMLLGNGDQAFVAVGIPTSVFEGPAGDRLRWNLAGLAAAAGLAVAAALIGGQFFFVRRVGALVAGTRAVAGGDFNTQIPVAGRDELSNLGRAFNNMTSELATHRQAADEAATQLRAVFEATTEGLLVSAPASGTTVEVNPALARLLGYSREELIGGHPARFIDPADHAKFVDIVPKALAGEDSRIRAAMRRKDGSTFTAEVTAVTFQFRGERHVLSTVLDISDQVATERLLEDRVAERTAELEALLDVSRDAGREMDVRRVASAVLKHLQPVVPASFMMLMSRDVSARVTVVGAVDADGVTIEPLLGLVLGAESAPAEMFGELSQTDPFIHIDVLSGDEYAAAYQRQFHEFAYLPAVRKARATLLAPLAHKGAVVGILALAREQPDGFAVTDGALVMGFASQAAAAFANARLFEEAGERAREVTALLETATAVSSTIDLDDVVDTILTRAETTIGFDAATLLTVEGEDAFVVAARLAGGGVVKEMEGFRVSLRGPLSPFVEGLRRRDAVAIPDLTELSGGAALYREALGPFIQLPPYRLARSFLAVPLAHQDRLLGFLVLLRNEPAAFGPRQCDLALGFAAQAGAAFEHARLFHEADVRNEELSTLLDVAGAIGSTLDLQPLLLLVLKQLKQVVDYSQASVSEMSPDGALAVIASQRGDGEVNVAPMGTRFPAWMLAAPAALGLFRRGEVTVIPDVLADERPAQEFRAAVGDALPVFSETRAWMAVPLLVNGELIGLLTASHVRPGGFTEHDAELAKAFAAPAAAGIANARLFEAEQRRAQQNEALASLAAELRIGERITTTLTQLTGRILASTGAVACVITVAGRHQTDAVRLGGAGFPAGYLDASPPQLANQVIGLAREAEEAGRWQVTLNARAQLLETPEVAPLHPFLREATWEHTAIVPLSFGGEVGGAITLCYVTAADLEREDQGFIRAVADQVGLALETSRLFGETVRQSRENATLARVAAEFLAGGETASVLEQAARLVCEATGAFACSLVLIEGRRVLHSVGHGLPSGFIETAAVGWAAGAVNPLEPAMQTQLAASYRLDPAVFEQLPAWDPHFAVIRGAGWTGKWLAATPLVYRGEALGTLVTYHDEVLKPRSEAGQFMRALADQIAIGAANLRLFERAERRAREKEALATVASQLTLDLPLRDVLDGIAEAVVRSAGARACAIYLLDPEDDRFKAAGSSGLDPWLWDLIQQLPESDAQTRRKLGERGEPVIIGRYNEALASHPGVDPAMRERALAIPWGTTVMIPMQSRGKMAGTIVVAYADEAEPPAEEVQLLTAIADQAAAAIENAALFDKTERRAKESAALAATASSLTLDQPLRRTLDAIAANAASVSGAPATMLLIMDEATGAVTDIGSVGLPDALLGEVRRVIGLSTEAYSVEALLRGEPVLLPDAVERLVANADYQSLRPMAEQLPFQAILFVPLIYRGRRIGILNLGFRKDALPSADMQRILLGIANQAAVAIANVRLFELTEQRVRELEAFQEIAENITLVRPLTETLDTLAGIVLEATGALGCTVSLTDADTFEVTDCRGSGLPDGYYSGVIEAFRDPRWKTGLARFAKSDSVVVLDPARSTMLADPRYAPLHPFIAEVEWDYAAMFPLRVQGRLTGALSVYLRDGAEATERQLAFFGAIADQAAIAVENARLYSEADEQAREQQAVARIAATLTVDRSLEDMLAEVAQTIAEGTRAEGVALVVLRQDGLPPIIGDFGMPSGYAAGMARARMDFRAYWETINRTSETSIVTGAKAHILQTPEYGPVHHLVSDVRWDTIVRVPFIHRDRVRGLVALFLPAGPVDARELRLFRALADQASTAAESALLYSETSRQARENAALASIAAAATVDQPIGALLKTLSETIANSMGAVGCSVTLANWEADEDRFVSGSFGVPDGYIEAFMSAAMAAWDKRIPQFEWSRSMEPVVFRDNRVRFREDPDFELLRPYADVEWDTVVRTSFFYHQKARGILVLYLRADQDPSPSLLQAVRALADQTSVALENVSLFHQVDDRTRYLEALYAAEEVLHRSLKLEEVLDSVFDVVIDLLRSDGAALILMAEEGVRPRVIAKMRNADVPDGVVEVVESNLSGDPNVYRRLQSYPVGEVRVVSDASKMEDADYRARTADIGVNALLEVPLATSGRIVGLLEAVYRKPRRFTEAEKRVFGAVAKRIGVALENARLYEQAESLAAAQERQRLARELHDSVSQALYGIALGARTARTLLDRDATKAVEPVDYVLQLAEAGLAEMRALIFELRPESLAEQGLVVAIEKQAASLRARYGVPVEAALCEEPEVPLAVKEALYRVAQEAMHNVVKHARATKVRVQLCVEETEITLEIEDNGQGFDPRGEFPGHLGLRSMRERVTRIDGQFKVESAPGVGTTISVTLPRGTAETATP
ncbi:MAG: GAF domain-containing protein [Dehalococcoidia bacterium]